MDQTTIQFIAAFGLFALGILVGVFLQRNATGDGRKISRLQAKLAETEDRFNRYQADVTSHFMDTASKVQSLNKSYRDVHEQLAKGARTLCEGADVEDFLALSFSTQSKGSHRGATIEVKDDVSPPMDYAPKDKPEAKGTLSESYGFEGSVKDFDDQLEDDYKGKK